MVPLLQTRRFYKQSYFDFSLVGCQLVKCEERASSNGTIVAGLPDGVSKTEEARAQSAPEAIDEMSGLPYYITTKLDGTSVTMFRIDGRFGVCGHNFEYADDGKCSFWAWAHENGLEQRLIDASIDDVVIQGGILRCRHPAQSAQATTARLVRVYRARYCRR